MAPLPMLGNPYQLLVGISLPSNQSISPERKSPRPSPQVPSGEANILKKSYIKEFEDLSNRVHCFNVDIKRPLLLDSNMISITRFHHSNLELSSMPKYGIVQQKQVERAQNVTGPFPM